MLCCVMLPSALILFHFILHSEDVRVGDEADTLNLVESEGLLAVPVVAGRGDCESVIGVEDDALGLERRGVERHLHEGGLGEAESRARSGIGDERVAERLLVGNAVVRSAGVARSSGGIVEVHVLSLVWQT